MEENSKVSAPISPRTLMNNRGAMTLSNQLLETSKGLWPTSSIVVISSSGGNVSANMHFRSSQGSSCGCCPLLDCLPLSSFPLPFPNYPSCSPPHRRSGKVRNDAQQNPSRHNIPKQLFICDTAQKL